MGLCMMLVCYIIAVRKTYLRQVWNGWGALWHTLMGAFWALMLTALMVGGLPCWRWLSP